MLHVLQHIHVKSLGHRNPPDLLNQGFIAHVGPRKHPQPRIVETPLSRAKAILGGNGRTSPRNQGITLRLIIRHNEIRPVNELVEELEKEEAGPDGQAAGIVLRVLDGGAELGVVDDVIDAAFVRIVVDGHVVGGFDGVLGVHAEGKEGREGGEGGRRGEYEKTEGGG
jgi:hypothetical protein